MKNFRFEALWLLSERDATARHFPFAPQKNALVGGNHTGKSTSIRMLFHTFGCKTKPLGDEWDHQTATAVEFLIEKIRYIMYRGQNVFALFNAARTLLWATDDHGVLRDSLSELFGFTLPLITQQGEIRQARPAFFFLPFYIDQDASWGANWLTFDSLGEFVDWQRPIIELALGIRTSEYWKLHSTLSAKKKEFDEVSYEQRVLGDAKKQLKAKFPRAGWYRGALAFKDELRQLELRASHIAVKHEELRSELADAAANRDVLRGQLALIDEALGAHDKDMSFLDGRRVGEPIACPTCGTEHEHTFHQ